MNKVLLSGKDIAALTGSDLPIDVQKTLKAIEEAELAEERERCEDSLYAFLQAGWKYIDPNPFVDGWHLQAIAEHLEGVCDGEIKRLIINQPPRTSKSSMMVAFDAWCWAQAKVSDTSGPGVQFLHSSYAQTLSIRDSVKTRRLIGSPWYQKLWGERFMLMGDQNAKTRFDNDKGGYRLATSVGGALTGEGGGVIIIDDPHNAVEMESEVVRASTVEWFDNSLSTRLNNARTGAIILVMQRLHEDDLTGHILASGDDSWVHLMLPMRYERERARIIYPNIIGWSDPRKEDGELLVPERYDEVSVDRLERQLGPFGSAGQLQQRPEPKGGGILKREWWQDFDADKFPPMEYIVASLDCAYTEKQENDFSALTIWGVWHDTGETTGQVTPAGMAGQSQFIRSSRVENEDIPRIMLMHAWQDHLALHDLVQKVAESCRKMKVDLLLVENKASGISVSQELRRLYGHEDFGVQLVDPRGQDKVARTYAVQHLFAEGIIYAPHSFSWADMVITQCASFPKGKHDDLVDTTTQALQHLRVTGMIQRGEERTAEINQRKQFAGNTGDAPLYPV